jgi:predicted nucleotidyltransferase
MQGSLSAPLKNRTMLFLKEKDKEILVSIIKKSFTIPIEIWAYGSRIDGSAHDASDLDLIIRSQDLSPIEWVEMENFRTSLRESKLPFLVEARDWAKVPEFFQAQIIKHHEVVYKVAGVASGNK